MRARKDLSPPRNISQFFDKTKHDRTSIFWWTREHAKDHSMQYCEQTWNGTAKIGKPTGRTLPHHHLPKYGGNTNTKNTQWRVKKLVERVMATDSCTATWFFFFRRFRRRVWRQNISSHAHVSQCHTLDHRSSHAPSCGSSFGMCCILHLKGHPLTTHFIDHSLMCLTHVLPFAPHHLRQHWLHCLWLESGDYPAPLRTEDCSLSVWSYPLLSLFLKLGCRGLTDSQPTSGWIWWSRICVNFIGMQEPDGSVKRQHRSWGGIIRRSSGEIPRVNWNPKHPKTYRIFWQSSTKRTIFQQSCSFVSFWWQWGRDSDDNQGQEPAHASCVKNAWC